MFIYSAVLSLSLQVSYTVSYVFQPEGGINFIRTFHKQKEAQNISFLGNATLHLGFLCSEIA